MDGFESAYRRHFASVFRFAMSVTGRRDAAEDLTAEAFLELHRHADAIGLDQLPAWLFVVVRNRARDLWRRQVVEQRHTLWLAEHQSNSVLPTTTPVLDVGCPSEAGATSVSGVALCLGIYGWRDRRARA